MSKDREHPIVKPTDLRSITRRSDRCLTTVTVHLDFDWRMAWLTFGEAHLRCDKNSGEWTLTAYLKAGMVDMEHDSAYALSLPLIGVTTDGVWYHRTNYVGWVSPDVDREFGHGFRVPRPGYDPMAHPDARKCEDAEWCKRDGEHWMVEYLPPFDAELAKALAGKKVEIHIGPAIPEEDGS